MQELNPVVEWITDIMTRLGYPGLIILMFLENLLPPVPSEKIIMPLAGFVASQGKLRLISVIFAGVFGSVLGTLPWYYVGRYFGKEPLQNLASRHGRWLRISSQDIEKSTRWFDRHSEKAVFFCRLIPGVRSVISIPAGISHMPVFPFLLYSALGTTIWLGVLAVAGFVLGRNYLLVAEYIRPLSFAVMIAIAIGAGIWLWKRRQRRSSHR